MEDFLVGQNNDGGDTGARGNLQISQNRICAQQKGEKCGDKAGGTQIVFLLAFAPHEGPDGSSDGHKSRGQKNEVPAL